MYRMFENVDKEATSPSFPAYKPGKLNRQSFIDLFNNNRYSNVYYYIIQVHLETEL